MFGIPFEELVILAVLAFILFGPQKLPEYAAKAGRLVAKLRQATSELNREVHSQNPFQYPPEPASSPAAESTCPHCQHKITGVFAFCPNCGQRLHEEPVSPYHQPPPPPSLEMLVAASVPPAPAPEVAPPPEISAPPPAAPAAGGQVAIRLLGDEEVEAAYMIINEAAQAYKGLIPADCWHEPYMPLEELRAEIAAGVRFWAAADADRLLGVMGRQDLGRVTLVRHA